MSSGPPDLPLKTTVSYHLHNHPDCCRHCDLPRGKEDDANGHHEDVCPPPPGLFSQVHNNFIRKKYGKILVRSHLILVEQS